LAAQRFQTKSTIPGGAFLKSIEWLAQDTISCRDIRLKVSETLAFTKAEGDVQVAIYKPREMVEEMAQVLQGINVQRMLELGLWQGGSAIFFEHHLELERFVGVDIGSRFPFLERYIERHRLGERVRVRSSTSQDDEAAFEEIFRKDFAGADLDLIIDDASHDLKETRKSFEICFPHLRAGGLYIIEDWSWGHVSKLHPQRMPPSPLVIELLLICACWGDIIRRIHVNRFFVVIERGEAPLERKTMKLETHYYPRGLPFPWKRGERIRTQVRWLRRVASNLVRWFRREMP
jgi:predicted O-methyltransferase YrrM